MSTTIRIAEHPLLDAGVFLARHREPLGAAPSPQWLLDLHAADAAAPLVRSEDVRAAVRDLLRHGGYKPTGRGKPASEYLVRAAGEAGLPRINVAVDTCNAVSLHSGLPVSVVDLDLAVPPLSIAIAPSDTTYVFNRAGQEMRVDGLVCLFDAEGACANAVKDSQRTKTHDATRNVLTVVWGTNALPGRTAATVRWYRELLERAGASTADADMESGP